VKRLERVRALLEREQGYKDYGFTHSSPSHMHVRFMPHVFALAGQLKPGTRVLDVGSGNGFTCGEFLKRGCRVVGIDLSRQGIEVARKAYPQARFEVLPADDKLLDSLGEEPFDLVVSTEVVEHLYSPRAYAKGCFEALKPGGRFICTTPYHGYLKNLVLAVLNKWDSHANPLWDGGHIKLWSRKTMTSLLTETGFTNIQFRGAGRLPYLWMTMVMSGDKPVDEP
jgi:2-polyprenyl-3-methyl-5-hydroxy-6-metoxy-1,4-benzoquinol methylase